MLLHPDTAHTGGINKSCEIRKMVYFRLKIKHGKSANNLYSSWEEISNFHREDMWVDLRGVKSKNPGVGADLGSV